MGEPTPPEKPLFVDRRIEIDAPACRIWDVLTRHPFIDLWTSEFSPEGRPIHIESGWSLGGPVLWKGADDEVMFAGTVTALKLDKLLRFTVADVRGTQPGPAMLQESITYELSARNGRTSLRVLQGDFSGEVEGRKRYRLSDRAWYRILHKVRQLAER